MTSTAFLRKITDLTANNTPFLFLVDFEKQFPQVYTWEEAAQQGLYFSVNGISNVEEKPTGEINPHLISYPIEKNRYGKAFRQVVKELQQGNSFLLNLTFPTEIEIKASLSDLFFHTKASYKLFKKDAFTVFSPECFIKIKDGFVYTYPMKGTVDASLPNAQELLHNNPKETFEHNTIVDLMRNDLSQIAKKVTVTKFRYAETLTTAQGDLLQTSSEIRGELQPNWRENLGELLLNLLPAGSVSGAPKAKTCDIIKANEVGPRGYYTGVFGVFDGTNLDSGVMIRYIEQKNGRTYFRSGGGITALSNETEEYAELLKKIYLPLF